MTVTDQASLIYLFESKIDEAVSYLPKMSASEKLRAVGFWNVVSEKIQDIVNSSAADISAIALKMRENESEKIAFEMNNPDPASIVPQSNVTSEFVALTSNYDLCGRNGQYQTLDIGNSQFLSPENYSISTETPMNNSVTSIQNINQMSNTFINSSQNNVSGHCVVTNSVSHIASETAVINSSHARSLPNESNQCIKNTDFGSEDFTQEDRPSYQSSENSEKYPSCTSPERLPPVVIHAKVVESNKRTKGGNERKLLPLRNVPKRNTKRKSASKNVKSHAFISNSSSDSFSGYKSDFECGTNSRDSESNQAESNFNLKDCSSNQVNHCTNTKSSDSSQTVQSINARDCDSIKVDHNTSIKYSNLNQSEPSTSTRIFGHNQVELSTNIKDTDSNEAEPIVSFVVSNTEKILFKNDINVDELLGNSSEKDCDKKLSDDSEQAVDSKRYSCPDCFSKFSTKGNLNVHMRRHTGDRPYSCNKCSATFTTRGNLKRHVRTHTGEKPWECSDCGSRFTEKKSLVVHMRRHTGEKPYECEVCLKCFSQKCALQMHMDVHTDLRSHLCECCGKSFKQKSQLVVHKLRHDNVKKYQCASCPSRFITKGDFERHKRSHTGERPFTCEICSRSFTRQQSLNEHMNRHYGVRPYACKICGREFHDMSACYKHEKQKHKSGNQKHLKSEDEPISEPSKIKDNSRVPSNVTYEIIEFCASGTLKPGTDSISKDPGANVEAQQTISTIIENFFVEK